MRRPPPPIILVIHILDEISWDPFHFRISLNSPHLGLTCSSVIWQPAVKTCSQRALAAPQPPGKHLACTNFPLFLGIPPFSLHILHIATLHTFPRYYLSSDTGYLPFFAKLIPFDLALCSHGRPDAPGAWCFGRVPHSIRRTRPAA